MFSQRGKSQQLRPRISRNPWQWRICVRNHTACSSSVFAIYSQTLPSHSTRYTVPLIGECGKHAPSSLGSEWWLDAPGKADGPPVATSRVLPVRLRHNQGRYRKEEPTPKYEGQCSMSPHIARTDALVDVGCLLFFLPGRWCTPLPSLEASQCRHSFSVQSIAHSHASSERSFRVGVEAPQIWEKGMQLRIANLLWAQKKKKMKNKTLITARPPNPYAVFGDGGAGAFDLPPRDVGQATPSRCLPGRHTHRLSWRQA